MKKILLIAFVCFSSVLTIHAQQIETPIDRPADYEYLSAPDSMGKRIPLKMPDMSLKKTTGSKGELPYPIIFIHGLNSFSSTWDDFTDSLDINFGFMYGGRLDFCLNYDKNNTKANTDFYPTTGADIRFYMPSYFKVADYYYINFDVGYDGSFHPDGSAFDVMSNQSAVVKQGIALKRAIQEIRNLTGKDKVILVCHSMGGLAAREYLQNLVQADGKHHVAKLATTGTPHGGSDQVTGGTVLSGVDCQSEAYRDLRTTYSGSGDQGVYLFGGNEYNSVMDLTFCSKFYNINVNCNSNPSGDNIIGLNNKWIPTDLSYACVIGIGSILGGDGCVGHVQANINNYEPTCNADTFVLVEPPIFTKAWHIELPKLIPANIQLMDEPNEYALSYNINFDKNYLGFITRQPVGGYSYDWDDFKFNVPVESNVRVSMDNIDLSLGSVYVRILNMNKNVLGNTYSSAGISSTIDYNQKITAGDYYLEIYAAPNMTSYKYPYNFILSKGTIADFASDITSGCEGMSVYFYNQSTENPNSLKWQFQGGSPSSSTSNNQHVTYNTPGTYAVTLIATNANGGDTITKYITVYPNPAQPMISTGGSLTFCQGSSVTLSAPSSAYYSWSNGKTTQSITVTTSGNFTVHVSNSNYCASAESNPVTINVIQNPAQPTISTGGSPTFCQGGSVTLSAPSSSFYSWSDGETTQSITVMTSGNFTVHVSNSNYCASAESNPVSINVVSNPSQPTITTGSSTTFCQGGNVTLSLPFSDFYSWSDGETTQNITVKTSGNFTGHVSNSNYCASAESNPVTVNVSPAPAAYVTSIPPICEGDTLKLVGGVNNSSNYFWIINNSDGSSNGNWVPGFGAKDIHTQYVPGTNDINKGFIVFTFYAQSPSCTDGTATITVIINKKPNITIQTTNPADSCDGTATVTASNGTQPYNYSWSSSGTDATITNLCGGAYSVTVTDAAGCRTSGSTVITGIENVQAMESMVLVYPNPNTGEFTLEIKLDKPQKISVKIFSDNGQEVLQKTYKGLSGTFNKKYDLRSFPAGIYYIEVMEGDKHITKKIIKE